MPTPSPHGTAQRPPLVKRHSSQSSHNSKANGVSVGSAGEHQPLRHTVKSGRHHTKAVLPRNHSSARNLAKLVRHAHDDGHHHRKQHVRDRSHEGDTEIRLPGSLDDSRSRPAPMKRNMTATQLPRNVSHTKLKKNLSHGHLTRLGSGRNLAVPTVEQGGNKRKTRPVSADLDTVVKDTQGQQEGEVRQEGKQKKVGFAVGSSGDNSEDEAAPQMEGSGLQEDEWTDQSASASPFSTRQNTANNSRRTSVAFEKPVDKGQSQGGTAENDGNAQLHDVQQQQQATKLEAVESGSSGDDDNSDDQDTDQPSMPQVNKRDGQETAEASSQSPSESKSTQRSPLHAAKNHPNPTTRQIFGRSGSSGRPVPALVSNVSALDDARSAKGSPALSVRSSKSNIGGEQDPDELISRFLPSESHPSTGSGANTMVNTPMTRSFHTPESESTLAAQHRDKAKGSGFQLGPVSPGSTLSASSGATTPAHARSRTELRMMTEKAMADMEDAHANNPVIPPHVFDRRNESLRAPRRSCDFRSGLSSRTTLVMGPELFEGRFRGIDNELKMVQRFRDPIVESVARLQRCKASNFPALRSRLRDQKASSSKQLPISKSAVALSKQISSASPRSPGMSSAKSATQLKRPESRPSRVSFAREPPPGESQEQEDGVGVEEVARRLWDSVGA